MTMTGAEAIRLSNSSGSSSWRADWGVGRGSVKEQALIHQVEGDPRGRERSSTSLQGQQPGKGELGSAAAPRPVFFCPPPAFPFMQMLL